MFRLSRFCIILSGTGGKISEQAMFISAMLSRLSQAYRVSTAVLPGNNFKKSLII